MWLISCIVFYQKYDGANPLLLRAPPILSQPNPHGAQIVPLGALKKNLYSSFFIQ